MIDCSNIYIKNRNNENQMCNVSNSSSDKKLLETYIYTLRKTISFEQTEKYIMYVWIPM